jgi:hypothetical protein
MLLALRSAQNGNMEQRAVGRQSCLHRSNIDPRIGAILPCTQGKCAVRKTEYEFIRASGL